MRQLSETLFNALLAGDLHKLLEYVKADDTLDMEFRGNSFTLYYRGGAILSVNETKSKKYVWNQLDAKYNDEHELKNNPENFEEYIPEAKHLIDYHICISKKNHLGEKEIQQLVVKENNYSPNSNDTDYFIVDMEYEGGKKKNRPRFDLIALRWDSNSAARQKDVISLAIIEVKQGIESIRTTYYEKDGKMCINPGLRKHQKDYLEFIEGKTLPKFCDDMLIIFKQKCELGLIRANPKIEKIVKYTKNYPLQLEKPLHIDFICLLANYKSDSRALEIEFIGMEDCKFIKSSYAGYGLFANNLFTISPKYRNMSNEYKEYERQKQVDFYYEQRKLRSESVFGDAENFGHYNSTNKEGKIIKTVSFKFILKPANSKNNLFACIRDNALYYFDKHKISWWRQEEDGYFPSGNLVSSQIHCLNHLFALRTNDKAVKAIIEKATSMKFDKVLPSIIDKDPESFISFEFVLDNDKLLGENDDGWGRGTLCTSIDAMILAEKDGAKWLIPIEWKYTETYKREDKTNTKRIERYADLIKSSKRLKTPQDGIPHSVFFVEPNYELMRQTLFCEQLIAKDYAIDFFHINIIPKENTQLRKAVENEFMLNLTNEAKFKIIDPQDLLSPLKGNDDYKELMEYLETRYWK
ncbi:MAG: hypothetical protein IKP54_09435 [Bacteroidales bacterium]|nr:hypothetical protein [Bacteroidales bacterium]